MGEDICLKNMVIKMNEKIKEISWKEFKVERVFKVNNSKAYHKNRLDCGNTDSYKLPYVTRTVQNNGLDDFVKDTEKYDENPSNVIVFGAENADFFYQPFRHITGNKMYVIENENINRYTGLFLVSVFRSSIKNTGYGYGKGLTGSRFLKRSIVLPVDEEGNPNWKFMENFMKEIEQAIDPKIKFKVHKINDNRELEDVEWIEYFVGDLFEVKRGRRLIKKHQVEGLKPYVSSTGLNNGVDNFISNKDNVRVYNDCLTIANSGSVGEVFYHPYEFVASDHVTHIKKKGLNKYQYLFLATIFKKLGEKYSFNREISDKRLKREKIMLPIDKKREPDWGFMEQYMKRMENELMRSII